VITLVRFVSFDSALSVRDGSGSPRPGDASAFLFVCRLVTARLKLSWLAVVFACLIVSSAEAQEPDKAAPTNYKVADVDGGAISLDGQFLSYTDWSTGDLALQDLETGEKRHLTNKGSWQAGSEFAQFEQAFSPDGKQVGYAWQIERDLCELRIIGLDGSEPRVIYRNEEITGIAVEDWSPDGKHILAILSKRDRTRQTVLVSVADSSLRVLRTHSSASRMMFSPDGQWIVYNFAPEEESPERYDIYLLPSDGSGGMPLVEHPANDIVLGWAPDGKSVLFASDRAGMSGAWVMQVVDGQPRGAPELVQPDIAIGVHWLGHTADGSYYYGQSAWVSDVYTATLDPATGALQPPQKLVSHVRLDTSPDWSPDGRYLAYASDSGSERNSPVLGIRSVRTGEERRLRLGITQVHAFQLHWSPDGRSLLAQGRLSPPTLPGVQAFYRIDAQTGESTPIVIGSLELSSNDPEVTQGGMEWPVWSSDGTAIFYRRSDTANGEQSLVVRDLETGRERELYRGNPRLAGENEQSTVPDQPTEMNHEGYFGASNLAVSPNGQQLAFIWSTPTSRVLNVIPTTARGGETRELFRVQPPERLFQPAWMPDGDQVLFGRGRIEGQEPRLELWRISAEGGESEYLGLAMEGLLLYGLSIHPNGQRIAFTAGRNLGSQTWVMKGLLP